MTRRPNGIPRTDLKYITPEEAERIAMRTSRRQADQPAARGADGGSRTDKAKSRSNHRWRELATLRDQIAPTLNASETIVLYTLWSMADARTRIAKVSASAIARRSPLCRRTVVSAIQSLIDKGHIQQVARGNIRGKSNHYRYLWDDET